MKIKSMTKAAIKSRRIYKYAILIGYYNEIYKPCFWESIALNFRVILKTEQLAKYIKENKK